MKCRKTLWSLVKGYWWVLGIVFSFTMSVFASNLRRNKNQKLVQERARSLLQNLFPDQPLYWQQKLGHERSLCRQRKQPQKLQQLGHGPPKVAGKWRKKLLLLFVTSGVIISILLFWYLNRNFNFKREETLANMCDERARMLQDQFNVSLNHVHALAILVSTFHHGKNPSAIDQVILQPY